MLDGFNTKRFNTVNLFDFWSLMNYNFWILKIRITRRAHCRQVLEVAFLAGRLALELQRPTF